MEMESHFIILLFVIITSLHYSFVDKNATVDKYRYECDDYAASLFNMLLKSANNTALIIIR